MDQLAKCLLEKDYRRDTPNLCICERKLFRCFSDLSFMSVFTLSFNSPNLLVEFSCCWPPYIDIGQRHP